MTSSGGGTAFSLVDNQTGEIIQRLSPRIKDVEIREV